MKYIIYLYLDFLRGVSLVMCNHNLKIRSNLGKFKNFVRAFGVENMRGIEYFGSGILYRLVDKKKNTYIFCCLTLFTTPPGFDPHGWIRLNFINSILPKILMIPGKSFKPKYVLPRMQYFSSLAPHEFSERHYEMSPTSKSIFLSYSIDNINFSVDYQQALWLTRAYPICLTFPCALRFTFFLCHFLLQIFDLHVTL